MPLSWGIETVPDYEGKLTIILYRPSIEENHHRTVVFFPGDVSDFAFSHSGDALFEGYPDVNEYIFTLENVCWEISSRIPGNFAIAVCKPAYMFGCSSVFSNFVPSDIVGTPRWGDTTRFGTSLTPGRILLSLLESLQYKLHPASGGIGSIWLIGFSKGCVVLSGILKERFPDLLGRIQTITFIDPGVHSEEATFGFGEEDFASFPRNIPINLWVSPYQFNDPLRPWLKREILHLNGRTAANLTLILKDEPRSLHAHFDSIKVGLEHSFRSE